MSIFAGLRSSSGASFWDAHAGDPIDQRFPLCVGIVGHPVIRHADVPPLEARVREVLQQLQRENPHTPLVVLSALRGDAERLGARIAIQVGAHLVAPLATSADTVRAHSTDTRTREEVDELLAAADASFVLPAEFDETQSAAPDRVLEAFVVAHTQILIALWDGEPGEVADIVRINLHGLPPDLDVPRSPLDIVDWGPVVHIATPRADATTTGASFSVEWKYTHAGDTCVSDTEDDARTRGFAAALARLDATNADLAHLRGRPRRAVDRERDRLLPPEDAARLSERDRRVLERYALADTLALQCQRWATVTVRALLTLVLVAYVALEAYDNVTRSWLGPADGPAPCTGLFLPGAVRSAVAWLGLWLFPAILVAAFFYYHWAKGREYDDRHLHYRALAEGLRVQLFWNVAGVERAVADHYLRKQAGELRWLRDAIRAGNLPIRTEELSRPSSVDDASRHLRLCLLRWVGAQHEYLVHASQREMRGADRYATAAKWCYWTGMALIVIVGALDIAGVMQLYSVACTRDFFFVGVALFLALSGTLAGYSERMIFIEHARQYERSRGIFARGVRALRDAIARNDVALARTILFDIGTEELQENGDWVLLHRTRSLDLPRGA